jgi:hypothetical protein
MGDLLMIIARLPFIDDFGAPRALIKSCLVFLPVE